MSIRQRIVLTIVSLGLLLIGIFGKGLYNHSSSDQITNKNTSQNQSQGVKVLLTTPPSLEGATISPTQIIEINFNKPMVRDATRISIDPPADYNTDLSSDHKIIKIIPSFKLGTSYTLTIKSGYATDTGEKLDQDEIFHFQTISYNGV